MSRNLIVFSMVRHWQLGMVKNSKKHKFSQQTINKPLSDLQRAPRDPQGAHEGPSVVGINVKMFTFTYKTRVHC